MVWDQFPVFTVEIKANQECFLKVAPTSKKKMERVNFTIQ